VGLFSVHWRSEHSPAHARRPFETLSVRPRVFARAALSGTRSKVAGGLRGARLAAVAATNDARIVAILLLLAALALGLEMAASFHLL